MSTDIEYMKIAMDLAKKGIGKVNPNPLVGAVIVKDNKIIGQGFHQKYGEAHAEVNAINSANESVEGATIYVSLEPCSHYGKTPPCSKAIIDNKFKKVVIGCPDPNKLVDGGGVKMLQDAGIEVEIGILQNELTEMNKVFFKYITKKRPYIILKSAVSLDGKIASKTGDSKWISCEKSRSYVHKLRNELKGIMVGVNTILKDNPNLNCRIDSKDKRNPIIIVVDSNLRTPENSNIIKNESEVIIACSKNADTNKITKLENLGVSIIKCETINNRVDLNNLAAELAKRGIDGILLEGGAELSYSAIKSGIVDEINLFIAPKIIGGRNAKSFISGEGIDKMSEAWNLKEMKSQKIGNDIMITAKF
ncbi:MAG: bifunctional diaminohydroxyphosphoribosylaminopyrimidine deaminase/5-amino-6-(5-phosphoribosylamino)uracil reductase RibD [Marinifilaceae bacterium]|jgi:diaminohydroxyphosphoribosylaminopyrimidine deaminase/5-amino-6-(5-phosphoribosylamino)uracil reductase|nr:bifunctional diaminohydroxyphosphoribosylaminopyrimidine deaminase/5-amino-6-(5-phosphoribosylamino)uracil reductase RibD [Marinifilaceae bacterium]